LVTFNKTANNVTDITYEVIQIFKKGVKTAANNVTAYLLAYDTPIVVRHSFSNLTNMVYGDYVVVDKSTIDSNGFIAYTFNLPGGGSPPGDCRFIGRLDLKADLTNGPGLVVLDNPVYPRFKLDRMKITLALKNSGGGGGTHSVSVTVKIMKVAAINSGDSSTGYDSEYTEVYSKSDSIDTGNTYTTISETGLTTVLDPRYDYMVLLILNCSTADFDFHVPEFYFGITHYQGGL